MEKNAPQLNEWIKIYPIYLDKTIKKSEGRRMGSQFCVENPTIKELYVIFKSMNLEVVAEDKHHPKDWMKRGRVVVRIKKDNKLVNNLLKNKNDLLKMCGGELITIKEKIAKAALEQPTEQKRKKKRK